MIAKNTLILMSLLLYFILYGIVYGQRNIIINVGSEPFNLNSIYSINGVDSIRIDQFKFYIGNQRGDYQLVDASDVDTYQLPFDDKLLIIGMDSLTNTSGKLDGVFDPLLGMYWAWNTGYIQLKIKGKYFSQGFNSPFDYHIGGYQAPYLTYKVVKIQSNNAPLTIDLKHFFSVLPIYSTPNIMLPGPISQEIFYNFTSSFK